MNALRSAADTGGYPKSDAGKGKLADYKYDLIPANKNVTLLLAGSDQFQEELARLPFKTELQAFVAPRTAEEERTDAVVPVRFFHDSRMTGLVGYVPRGLESVVIQAMTRLENRGVSTRIPAEIVKAKGKLRVSLLMGLTR